MVLRALARASFQRNSPSPPLVCAGGRFDLVYCISVFTHLNEKMQDQWILELRRILKPGGVLLLTIHGHRAAEGLDREGAASLKQNGLLHRHSRKMKNLLPEWYQTTWHSEEYIVGKLSSVFLNVRYETIPGGSQDVVIAWDDIRS